MSNSSKSHRAVAGKNVDEPVVRREKALALRLRDVSPFPSSFLRRCRIAQIHDKHGHSNLESGEYPHFKYRIAGRIFAKRQHSQTSFWDIQDQSGIIQLCVISSAVDQPESIKVVDVGDIVGVEGCVYITRRGQVTLKIETYVLLAKAFRTPPAKYHGVADIETRYRHRELDLMANAATRELFTIRAGTVAAVREWLNDHGFIEIETPVLQVLEGGATARPFLTYHNALAREMRLGISGELYLKRCAIGGLEKVYGLGKCFRNEGISHKHSPEFTLLEWEESYADYKDAVTICEEMISSVANRVRGTTKLTYKGEEVDFTPPWRRTTVRRCIRDRLGIDIYSAPLDEMVAFLGEKIPRENDWATVVNALYAKLVEPFIIQPTLVFDPPGDLLPLVRRQETNPKLAEQFDVVCLGMELGLGASELNDPDEQRARFVEQQEVRNTDELAESCPHDEEFVRALEYGMPPIGGGAIGIDRLVAILSCRESLREVIPFPLLREYRGL